ncbi:MAG: hypothetical protein AAF481_15345 [Acidobacteriota bacterium]
MRTTVELTDKQRAKLLELAARRGEKGFSGILQEALEQYFRIDEERNRKVSKAIRALGSLAPADADALEQEVQAVRQAWRTSDSP